MDSEGDVLNMEINEMSKAQLIEMLEKLRESRKRGYMKPPKTRRNQNPFSNLPEDLANKILDELKRGGAG